MNTDGAATVATSASPVFTSASYNFVAGDVNAWLYIASGTNWTAGWYKIASVASNAATLSAASGAGILKSLLTATTTAGCATTASPTGATWTIDYSQQAAAAFTYTDLASAGAGLLVSSAAKPFGKQQVGNSLAITGGTNFTPGRYVIASIGALNVATVIGPGNITTGAGVNGTGGQGGALATPGQAAAVLVNGNIVFIKAGTYSFASASTNIATGTISLNSSVLFCGYSTVRTVTNTDTKPVLQTNVSTATSFVNANGPAYNLTFDGNSQTACKLTTGGFFIRCNFINFNTASSGVNMFENCSMTTCSAAVMTAMSMSNCEAYANTSTPIILSGNGASASYILSHDNTGASTDGMSIGNHRVSNSSFFKNGRDGLTNAVATANVSTVVNCHSEQNVRFDFNLPAASGRATVYLINSSYFSTGTSGTTGTGLVTINVQSLSATAFVNGNSGNFALNNTAGAGALLRAAGYPGLFPEGLSTSYLDIGAIQHADPSVATAANPLGGYIT